MPNTSVTMLISQSPVHGQSPVQADGPDAPSVLLGQPATFSAIETTSLGATTAATRSGGHEREAVLEALYRDRDPLIDQEALGTLSDDDRARLSDIEREIDRWESHSAPVRDESLWEKLEALARGTLDLQARIAKKRTTG